MYIAYFEFLWLTHSQADREQQAAKQAQYTSKLARMREQIASRESTLADLKAQRCKTEVKSSLKSCIDFMHADAIRLIWHTIGIVRLLQDEKRQVTERYRQVQAELHDMRERVRQGEGAIKRMRGADRKIAGLGAELERMRADQAALQAKLKVEETKVHLHFRYYNTTINRFARISSAESVIDRCRRLGEREGTGARR
eukprot:SAG31_NODE_1402_length_8494_cov_4.344848_6_plen_198_part_00